MNNTLQDFLAPCIKYFVLIYQTIAVLLAFIAVLLALVHFVIITILVGVRFIWKGMTLITALFYVTDHSTLFMICSTLLIFAALDALRIFIKYKD